MCIFPEGEIGKNMENNSGVKMKLLYKFSLEMFLFDDIS